MEFDFDTAKKVVNHYKYLIGKPMSLITDETKIDKLVIVPVNQDHLKIFMTNYFRHDDLEKVLVDYGFSSGLVSINVVHEIKHMGSVIKKDLDKYLTDFGIEKAYLNPDF